MNKNNLNKKIKNAFDKAAPDILDSILADISSGNADATVTELPPIKKRLPVRRIAATAAALVLLSGSVLGIYSRYKNNIISVSLDVNPAVVMSVDPNEKVIDVTPKNSDGEKLVGDTELIGISLDSAVDTLITGMLDHGYLSDVSNSVLISVGSDDHEKAEELKTRLAQNVEDILLSDGFDGAVVGQTLDSADVAVLAEKHGITEGKAQLIKRIVSGSGDYYTFGELAGLGITELTLITSSAKNDVEGVETLGTPSDKAYVGKENAVSAALDHAGIEKDAINTVSADIDLRDGKVVYEIDLNYSGCDYGFMVNAADGSILKFSREITYDTSAPAETE